MTKKYTKDDLEKILDVCPSLAWIKDIEDRIVYVNSIYAQTFQRPKEDMIGRLEQEICGNSLNKEKILIGDKYRYFEVSEKEVWEGNQIIGKMGVAREVTLEKALSREFEEIYEQLTKDLHITEEPYNIVSVAETFSSIGEFIFNTILAKGLVVLIYDSSTERLEVGFEKGECIKWEKYRELPILYDYVKKRIKINSRFGETVETAGMMEDAYKELLETFDIKSTVEYPIIFAGHRVGMVYIYYTQSKAEIQKADTFMRYASLYLAMIIKNATLSDQVLREVKKSEYVQKEKKCVLDTTTDYILTIGQDLLKMKCMSNQWEKGLGWTASELEGMALNELHHPEDNKLLLVQLEQAKLRKEGVFCEVRCSCKNNTYKIITWHIHYLQDKGSYIFSGRDITESKQKQEESLMLKKALEIEKINRELLRHMSGTFKKPVNNLLNHIQILEKAFKEQEEGVEICLDVPKYIEMLKQNTYRLIRLINNLVDSKSIEVGAYQVRKTACDIVVLIKYICISVQDYVKENGIYFEFATEVDQLIIQCDPEKIERIMLNLISNAIKYTEVKGIIKIHIKKQNEEVYIHVMDNGEGIAEKRLPDIFKRFNHDENHFTRKREGSGIGLSIVKSLVEMHQGELQVNSQIGLGSEFIIKLPIIKDSQIVNTDDEKIYKHLNKAIQAWNIEFSDIYKYSYKMG